MTDDFSLVRLDIDGEAVRAILEALGVPPGAFDDFERPDDGADEETPRSRAPERDRSGPRTGETPPPGAGDERPPEPTEGAEDGRRRLLLAGTGVGVLALVAAVGAVLYRRRSDAADSPLPDIDLPIPGLGRLGGKDGDSPDPAPTPEPEEHGSRIDAAPLIGMAALAVGGVVVRLVQSRGE